jgi:methionyl-tRNA synthetase
MGKYIVTSALPYVNGVKHLGTLIGSLLPADVYARWLRLQGEDVLAICGTDEHGTPCEVAALEEGVPVAEYAEKYYHIQKDIYQRFRLSFDHFGRTSSPENRRMTQHLFLRLHQHGYIVERETEQLYCVDDSRFLPDRFVLGTCPHCGYQAARGDQCESCTRLLDPTDLVAPRCAICGRQNLVRRSSRHLFLDLPKLKDRIEAWVDTKKHWPRTTRSIAHKWLEEGLRERCITRDLKWGISVPLAGYEDKVFYVWFDAPIGYISISMEWARLTGDPDRWQAYWKDPETRLVQFLGKDNVPFHTVTWPAVMMGADDGFILADMVKGFEFLNYEEGKFSTSEGRGVFTDQALELFPADYWRYYLLVIAPERGDSSFEWPGFQQAVNKDLADVLGNFVHRTLTFIHSRFQGRVPPAEALSARDESMRERTAALAQQLRVEMEHYRFQMSVRTLRELWSECNRYFDEKAPWLAIKTDRAGAATTLSVAAHLCRSIAVLTAPFLPETSSSLYGLLGLSEDVHRSRWEEAVDFGCLAGRALPPTPKPLFSKIPDETIAMLREKFAGKGSD